jgi:nucleotide-binding universal stress UspA family protein
MVSSAHGWHDSRNEPGLAVVAAEAQGLTRESVGMIVIGVDFSEGSAAAAAVALRMAAAGREEVRFIHVSSVRGTEGQPEGRAQWCERFDLRAEDVEVRTGVPWVELVRAADRHGASFLVAGTHGSTGAQPLRLGTTAGLIALRSEIPVVLVPRMRWTTQEVGHVHGGKLFEEKR